MKGSMTRKQALKYLNHLAAFELFRNGKLTALQANLYSDILNCYYNV